MGCARVRHTLCFLLWMAGTQKKNMKRMNLTELHIFFDLLRNSLWQQTVDYGGWGSGWAWGPVLRAVDGHQLATLVLEAVLSLPESLQPDKEAVEHLAKQVGANMLRHNSLNQDLVEIMGLLQSGGFHPVLLKGQGNAAFYSKPLLRKCGDLDLYVGTQRFEEACRILRLWRPELCVVGKNVKKHAEFRFGKTEVELHRYAEVQRYPYPDKPFQRIMDEALRLPDVVEIAGCRVAIPPARVNALYLFTHLWNHVRRGGVGLRQFCDLAMVLHHTYQQIDVDVLRTNLHQMKMLDEWNLVGNILVGYMGLPEAEFPLYRVEKAEKVSRFLQLVMVDGNFGKERGKTMGKGYLNGKLARMALDAERSLQLAKVSKVLAVKIFAGRFLQGLRTTVKGE